MLIETLLFGGGQEIAYAYASSPLNNVTLSLNLFRSDKATKDSLLCECHIEYLNVEGAMVMDGARVAFKGNSMALHSWCWAWC